MWTTGLVVAAICLHLSQKRTGFFVGGVSSPFGSGSQARQFAEALVGFVYGLHRLVRTTAIGMKIQHQAAIPLPDHTGPIGRSNRGSGPVGLFRKGTTSCG